MSSNEWEKHMIEQFPEWHVEDYAGNNFAILRDINDKNGNPVMVGIAELVTFMILDHESEKPLNTADYLKLRFEDDSWVDSNDAIKILLLIDENTGELHFGDDKNFYDMFDVDTQKYIRDHVHKFRREYWIGAGADDPDDYPFDYKLAKVKLICARFNEQGVPTYVSFQGVIEMLESSYDIYEEALLATANTPVQRTPIGNYETPYGDVLTDAEERIHIAVVSKDEDGEVTFQGSNA